MQHLFNEIYLSRAWWRWELTRLSRTALAACRPTWWTRTPPTGRPFSPSSGSTPDDPIKMAEKLVFFSLKDDKTGCTTVVIATYLSAHSFFYLSFAWRKKVEKKNPTPPPSIISECVQVDWLIGVKKGYPLLISQYIISFKLVFHSVRWAGEKNCQHC